MAGSAASKTHLTFGCDNMAGGLTCNAAINNVVLKSGRSATSKAGGCIFAKTSGYGDTFNLALTDVTFDDCKEVWDRS